MSKSNLIKIFSGLIILFSCVAATLADEPLEKPADKTIFSANRKFCVEMKLKDKKTTAYAISNQGKKQIRNKIWEMDGWYYNAALANDGEHLIIGYDKRNLLDLNYKPDQVMLSFYQNGKLFQTVRLNQLIENFSNLPRTASHYAWLKMFGFNENNLYSLTTFENREFLFDPSTGKPINIKLLEPSSAVSNANSSPTQETSKTSQTNPVSESPAQSSKSSKSYCFGLASSLIMIGLIHSSKSRF